MAEQVVTVLENIAEKLIDPIIRQFSYLFFYKSNIKSLIDVLDDINNKKVGVTLLVQEAQRNLEPIALDVEAWLKNVQEAEMKAQEVLKGTNAFTNGCMNGLCPNMKQRYLLSRKAVKQTGVIKELRIEGEKHTKVSYPKLPAGMVPSTSTATVEMFESQVSTTKEVIEALKNESISKIGICGLAGIGKTKMAKEIRDKVKVEKLFDEVAMSAVSQNQDLKKIQGELANMLGLKLQENDSIEDRGNQLRQRLRKGSGILVILDDLWEELDLDEIGIPVRGPGESNGCKVLMTSREEHVCIAMDTHKIFTIQLLSNEEAWDLFKKIAGDSVMNVDLHLIAREVLDECGCLPLAIVTVATALKGWGKNVWEDALQQLKTSTVTSIAGMDRKVYSSLRLSYDYLARMERSDKKEECNQLQQLFLLCCLFPEDCDISVEILVRYTMGLRFFSGDQHVEFARIRVQSLTDKLKSCYLLLPSDKDGHVKMHDVVRDFGLMEASNGKHVYFSRHDVQMNEWPLNDEVESYTAISIVSGKELELPLNLDCPSLQLLQLSGEGSIEISRDYFRAMKELRVVYLKSKLISFRSESMSIKCPPKTLEFFMNVQTLCLERCRFGTDIDLIGSMHKIKILCFFDCVIDVLPSEIGQLSNLKLLDLRETKLSSIEQGVLSCLTKLEELYMGMYFHDRGFHGHNEEKCASITELYSLSGLKTLQVYLYKEEDLLKLRDFSFDMLKKFDITKSPSLYSFCNYAILDQLILENVNLNLYQGTEIVGLLRRAEIVELKEVTGLKNIIREADKDGCMNMKKLIIDYNEDMVEICEGNLPRGAMGMLEVLRLDSIFAMKHLWTGPVKDPSFVNLKFIVIASCTEIVNLFSWSAATCLVQLEYLRVKNCRKLEEIISKDGAEDYNVTKMIEFPKLKIVQINRVPMFKSFVAVNDNNFSRPIFNEVLLPSLESVEVSGGNSMESLFDLGGVDILNKNGAKEIVLGQLQSIYMYRQTNLTQIWTNVPKQGFQGFHTLKSLSLYDCEKIEYLLSVSFAKLLPNLEKISLSDCKRMEQVIKMDDDDEEEEESITEKMDTINFPQLRELYLDSVGLKVFCHGNHDIEFPELHKVYINDCPNMNIFSSGSLSTPKLVSVQLRMYGDDESIWMGDLNKTVGCLYGRSKKGKDKEDDYDDLKKKKIGDWLEEEEQILNRRPRAFI